MHSPAANTFEAQPAPPTPLSYRRPSARRATSDDRTRAVMSVMLLALVAMLLGVLIFGPSDLYDKDQPKTMGYTADIIRNGRWILPLDVANQLPTKPPLYNWLSVPVVGWLGVWKEWGFKFPSIAAGLLTVWLIIYITGKLFRITGFQPVPVSSSRSQSTRWKPVIHEAGILAAMLWLASAPTVRCIYLCRPDMLLSMFVTAGWVFATLALRERDPRRRFRFALLLWLSVGGAALTKGPVALLPVLYIPFAAKLIHRRFGAMNRTGIAWGLPLAIAMTLAWLVPAYVQQPKHVRDELLGRQMVDRIASETPEGIAPKPLYYIFLWFNSEFQPWSLFVILALLSVLRLPRVRAARFKPWRWPWVKSPAAPAGVFVVLGLLFFCCSAGKRADYLLPLYPAAAVLAGYWFWLAARRVGTGPVRAACVPLLVGALLAYGRLGFGNKEIPPHASDHARIFARHVKAQVGRDSLAFLATGYGPIMPLLGRHPWGADALTAKWIIAPARDDWHPLITSGIVPDVEKKHHPGKLGLYRVSDGYLTSELKSRLAKAARVQTAEPNQPATRSSPAENEDTSQ
jgi:4-amino-4-deoxy-L-arabinose transferase-like glycosyltransferase